MELGHFMPRPSRYRLIFLPLSSALILVGCASVNLPLCPRIAAFSHGDGHVASPNLNEYVQLAATQRGISITIIGPFVAEYRGGWSSILWMEKNYPAMVCSFNPANVIDPATVYTVCVANSPSWMSVVKSGQLEDLFLKEYFFKASCYPRIDGT